MALVIEVDDVALGDRLVETIAAGEPGLFHPSLFTGAKDEKVVSIGIVTPGCVCFLLR